MGSRLKMRDGLIVRRGFTVESGMTITTGSVMMTGSMHLTGSMNITDEASAFNIVGNSFGQTYLQSLNGALVLNPGYGGVEITGIYPSLKVNGNITTDGIISLGKSTTSNAVIQRAQTPAGGYSLVVAAGNGLVDTYPHTMADGYGATLEMRAGNPTTDQYGGGILITANGHTSPLGAGNTIIFKNRTGVDTYTERMRIKYDGNVGIGTDNPTSLLHVNGTIRTDSSGTPASGVTGGGSPSNYYGTDDANYMGEPSIWLKINIAGAEYFFPGYE